MEDSNSNLLKLNNLVLTFYLEIIWTKIRITHVNIYIWKEKSLFFIRLLQPMPNNCM